MEASALRNLKASESSPKSQHKNKDQAIFDKSSIHDQGNRKSASLQRQAANQGWVSVKSIQRKGSPTWAGRGIAKGGLGPDIQEAHVLKNKEILNFLTPSKNPRRGGPHAGQWEPRTALCIFRP
jgi:hypothetical protein